MNIVYVGDVGDFHVRDKIVHLANNLDREALSVFSGASIEVFEQNSLKGLKIQRVQRLDLSLLAGSINKPILRNCLKAICYPVNILWFLLFRLSNRRAAYHAFTMYYIFLSAVVCRGFIATPQASEVFHRMRLSVWYRRLAVFSLRRASCVIVDSLEMQTCLKNYDIESVVHKNGFDTELIRRVIDSINVGVESNILSLRGIRSLYRIREIVSQRNDSGLESNISLVYPAADHEYKMGVIELMRGGDEDLGRLSKEDLYALMAATDLCVSIPETDSSPRSVYEAIFCGSVVAVSWSKYIDELPSCMRARLVLVDPTTPNWLEQSFIQAKKVRETKYIPSKEALEMCDSRLLSKKLIENFYRSL